MGFKHWILPNNQFKTHLFFSITTHHHPPTPMIVLNKIDTDLANFAMANRLQTRVRSEFFIFDQNLVLTLALERGGSGFAG